MKLKSFFVGIMSSILITSTALAAGMLPTFYFYSEGSGSAHIVERLVDCHVTDDSQNAGHAGTLAPGQSYEISWNFCSLDEIVLDETGQWEGAFEGVSFDLIGKGSFAVDIQEEGIPIGAHLTSTNQQGYQTWHKCATYHNRVNVTGTAFGVLTFKVTNIGTKIARDIDLVTYMGTNHSGFLSAHCPIQSDWGF